MRILLPLLVLFFTIPATGQNALSSSRKSSVYNYVYRIKPSEVWTLAKSGMQKANEKFLHTRIDSFYTDATPQPKLADGNYLLVHARGNRLIYELKTVGGLQYKLVNNNHDFVLALHTNEGELISDAKVEFNGKTIAFNKTVQAYQLEGYKKTGWV